MRWKRTYEDGPPAKSVFPGGLVSEQDAYALGGKSPIVDDLKKDDALVAPGSPRYLSGTFAAGHC